MKLNTIIFLIGLIIFQSERVLVHSITQPYVVGEEINEELYDQCNEWELDSANAMLFFHSSKEISSIEKNSLFYTLPCEVKGVVEINDTIFDYTINSASWAELRYKNEFYKYLGCFQCDVPFLMEAE